MHEKLITAIRSFYLSDGGSRLSLQDPLLEEKNELETIAENECDKAAVVRTDISFAIIHSIILS